MLYEKDGRLYAERADGYHLAGVSVKERRRTVVEVESVTLEVEDATVKLPDGAMPTTADEVVRRHHVTEDSPFKSKAVTARKAATKKTGA